MTNEEKVARRYATVWGPRFKAKLCRYCGKPNERHPKVLCGACKDKKAAFQKALKVETFNAYGGCFCSCCNEQELAFLTIDHVTAKKKDDTWQRGGWVLYRELKQRGFPPGFLVMCFNCNCGRQLNGGICPHKK
jgi:hypothetical protein